MIQSNTLRIGNLVSYNGDVEQIEEIRKFHVRFKNDDDLYSYEDLEPIPITEDILVRMGFVNNGQGIYDKEDWLVSLRKRGNSKEGLYHALNVPDCYLRWVHEIQNLYFALNFEELTLIDL